MTCAPPPLEVDVEGGAAVVLAGGTCEVVLGDGAGWEDDETMTPPPVEVDAAGADELCA